jgi:hypothetical protein
VNPQPSSLKIIDSSNIALIGYGGNMSADRERGIVELVNCKNVLIANMGRFMKSKLPETTYYYVKEMSDSETNAIDAVTIVNLIKRGIYMDFQ